MLSETLFHGHLQGIQPPVYLLHHAVWRADEVRGCAGIGMVLEPLDHTLPCDAARAWNRTVLCFGVQLVHRAQGMLTQAVEFLRKQPAPFRSGGLVKRERMTHVAVECAMHAANNGRHADASGEGDEVLWTFVPFRLPEGISEIHHLQRVAGLEGRAEKSAGLTSANVLHDEFQPSVVLVENGVGSSQSS